MVLSPENSASPLFSMVVGVFLLEELIVMVTPDIEILPSFTILAGGTTENVLDSIVVLPSRVTTFSIVNSESDIFVSSY